MKDPSDHHGQRARATRANVIRAPEEELISILLDE